MTSPVLVSNKFYKVIPVLVPRGVSTPFLHGSDFALEALSRDLRDLPPVTAFLQCTLAQVTSIYSATWHHNHRYPLTCLVNAF